MSPAPATRDLLEELLWRGLIHQSTEGAAAALRSGPLSGYCGFDPTAPSLHVGSLVQIMGLVHLQRAGHRPVALVGGGTGLIGDPSGKASERPLADADTVRANATAIGRQLAQFLDADGPRGARILDNAAWLAPLRAVDLLRDVGKHFSINYMLAKDSVKSRLGEGISFTEFAYMLLQAYDFLELYRREGVTLQTGGSDQWGNITAGTELIRRTTGGSAHGVTLPLVTRADGSKFGKTEAGNVWLDASLTSPWRFYQFWINVDDRDASAYLRMFTLLEREEVEALDRALAERPEAREAQSALAVEVTARVHGADAARHARDAARLLFDRRADPRDLTSESLHMLRDELPYRHLTTLHDHHAVRQGEGVQLAVLDMLVDTGLATSRGDARRQVQQGAVSVNGRRLAADEHFVDASDALAGSFFLLRKGARELALVELT
jgi:tyrosyl-tRNA synthetase